jgi:predicted nucleic-acid-binding protein
MIAADTNIVVRLLTGDDPAQAGRASSLFAAETIFLSKTVMLESEWVLRRLYRLDRSAVLAALSGLAALPNVRCEDEAALGDAFLSARQGMDFADALHLASAGAAAYFATFDEELMKRAPKAGGVPSPSGLRRHRQRNHLGDGR